MDFLQMDEELLEDMRFTLSYSSENVKINKPSFHMKANIIKYIKGGQIKQIIQLIDMSKDIK